MLLNLSLGKFYGLDSILELLIILVTSVISIYSFKIYRLVKDNNYRLFSFAFLSIAGSLIFKILANITIGHRFTLQTARMIYTITKELEYMDLINFFSFILYKGLYLLGFLILFFIITKNREKIFLLIYSGIMIILFSTYFDWIFHVTLIFYITLVFLLIFLTDYYYKNYKRIKTNNTLFVFTAFLLILIGHIFFVFSHIDTRFYFVGEITLFSGFLCLLLNQIKINNEQKKNKVRSSKRHT